MSAQHTPTCLCVKCGDPLDDCACPTNYWVSHVVSIRLADGSKVITTEKGRTQAEANERALKFREGACLDADDGCDSFHCEELGCTGACHAIAEAS